MKKILVTGGAGFIGNSMIKNLLNSKFQVNCLDLKEPNIKKRKILIFLKPTFLMKK